MKWKKYTIETTTAAEDFMSSMLMELGIEGIEIEDNIPLTKEDHPEYKIIYVTSEEFGNDFISSINDKNTAQFHDKYRNADVLLIDDIQFFTGKERMQEEFFHTFNKLHAEGKQIVITSDKPPRELKTLEDRIRNRFEW